ncbi:MAG: threonine--tRNA ligase, partial [Chloroflexi bacterium]
MDEGCRDSREIGMTKELVSEAADEGAPEPTVDATAAGEEEQFEAPERGSAEELLDAGAHDAQDAMRHSTAHVMAEAVLDLVPGAKLGIGPAITDGFYYDFQLPRALTPGDLEAIEARMAESVAADHPFVRRELSPAEGRAFFVERDQPFKVEILDDLAARAKAEGSPMPPVSVYEHGAFVDLCKGPHVASTGKIGPFKLLAVAGAYWRGDEKRPMLQRIYGTVWPTQKELEDYLWRREEAKKRDHRRLGIQLDLFSFHDISPGAAFWHPKGWTLYRTLESAMRELQARRGYVEVYTPPLVHKRLWEQSGHWDLYREHMFLVEAEDQTFSLKPMNCPESTYIYRSRVRSYRELPLRIAEYGKLHRNELSGTLSGLTRVRHFVTDDGHIYLRPDQIGSEIEALLGEVREAYGWVGLEPRFTFGTRPDKALGDVALWDRAETLIGDALKRSGMSYRVKEKDGAFYAPKIDIQVEDALGREWQTATIQVDLVMLPERFDLHYIDEEGRPQRPVAIHRGRPDRALRGCVPLLACARPGDRDSDRRSPRPGGRGARRRPAIARPAGRGRRVVDADAEQDPARAGAEDPVHARARRPRGRGTLGDGPQAGSRPGRGAAHRGMGGAGGAAGGRGSGASPELTAVRGGATGAARRAALRRADRPIEERVQPSLVVGRVIHDRLSVLRALDDPRLDGPAARLVGVGEVMGVVDAQARVGRALRDEERPAVELHDGARRAQRREVVARFDPCRDVRGVLEPRRVAVTGELGTNRDPDVRVAAVLPRRGDAGF